MCVLSNQRKKRGDFYSILSGPSHKNSSFHFGKKVLFVRRLKHTKHMSFVLRASSSLWASSSAPSARRRRRRGGGDGSGGRLRGGHDEGRRRRNTRGGLKTLTMVSASSSDVTDDDDAKEAATTVVVNEGNDENDDNNNNDNNPFLGAAEEIGVIEWPTAGKALQTTGVVIVGIVLSSVFLLVVNEALSALSGKIFS